MLRIALTGGIGSGKSTVTNYLRALGATVLDADEYSHQITTKGEPTLERISQVFGPQVLKKDGSLDRVALRQLVFADNKARTDLEAILHPEIRRRMFIAEAQVEAPYCVFSIPLLVETNQTGHFDRILVVETEKTIRQERIAHRSNLSTEQIAAILATQASDQERRQTADDLIVNDGSLRTLAVRVKEIHELYLELAQKLSK